MPLSDFPPELLLKIATHLDAAETNVLACTNRGLHNLLNDGLYCWDVTQTLSGSLIWGAENGVEGTIQWAVDAAQKFKLISESFHIALQIAAMQGHVPIVELLLKVHGINPNFEGGRLQAAPLLLAADKGHSAIVELLLAVVNINPDVRGGDGHGHTPLISACHMGHVSIVQQLLARTDVDFNCTGNYHGFCGTPLITACRERHPEIIKLLLAKDGIEINLVHGSTPLVIAAERGLVEVMEILVRDNNLNPNIADEDGDYALGEAAYEGYIDAMKLLLTRPDVDPNIAGPNGTTPLILGACFPDVVELLLGQQGIDVNCQENSGDFSTALIETARYHRLESAKLLLERDDIKVNIADLNGWTAIHWACYRASLEIVNLLLERDLERDDLDINARDVNWKTPLALACRKENSRSIPIIRSLLSHRKTDPNILNRNSDSILADFMKYRHEMDSGYADEIESLLRKAGAM
ncbi:Ankyrin repeat-containing domain protein [Elaphomyces granulatus]